MIKKRGGGERSEPEGIVNSQLAIKYSSEKYFLIILLYSSTERSFFLLNSKLS